MMETTETTAEGVLAEFRRMAEGSINVPDLAWWVEFNGKSEFEQATELARDLPRELWPYTYQNDTFGWCIKHPLIWEPTGFHFSPAQLARRLQVVTKHVQDYIDAGDWRMASILVSSPCRIDWVLEHEQEMGKPAFRECLASSWLHMELPHILDRRTTTAAFKRAGWMTDITGEVNDPSAPGRTTMPITLWRGTTDRRGKFGMSWTAEPERAVWFAKRWAQNVEGVVDGGQGYVWEAEVYPDRLLAYFYGRGEAEYVVDTAGLKVKEHRP